MTKVLYLLNPITLKPNRLEVGVLLQVLNLLEAFKVRQRLSLIPL